VAQTYNPSYSGGRDQEDPGSKPARAKSLQDPTSKIPIMKKKGGLAQWLKVKALSSSPSTTKRKRTHKQGTLAKMCREKNPHTLMMGM
jgi:hypothetical protein